ncbi:MAG: hypothetical protein LBN95_10980 [Prevotellaceae bacterium]|jgi:hypothetical protein|nr:hypothetical protein [Prevotellaceae bacterium]
MKKLFLSVIALFFGVVCISAQDVDVAENNENLKRDFYRIGKDDSQMLNYFQKNGYADFYSSFGKACRTSKVGRGLLIGGLASVGTGATFLTFGALYNFGVLRTNYVDPQIFGLAFMLTGYVMFVGGQFVTIASVPVAIVGGTRKRNIKSNFEQQYLTKPLSSALQPQINFGINTDGIGFMVNF